VGNEEEVMWCFSPAAKATQVMYIAKLKDGPKRVKKIFSMIWKKFLKWYDGGEKNGII
jgi:hypothetical protein